jgi:hypothetical protein
MGEDERVVVELGELLPALDAVSAAAQKAHKGARPPVDVDAVRRALPRCQRDLSGLKRRFFSGLGGQAAVERHRAEGRDELAWHIVRCATPLMAAEWAISVCWSRLGEYAVTHPGGAVPGFAPPRD